MRIYLDDDSASDLLLKLLTSSGNDVQRPVDAGLAGEDDPVHLAHAARNIRTLLTKNHHDFEQLHDLVMAVTGHHPGILVVRSDNNPKRDLNEAGIARALRKLLAAGVEISDHFYMLNHWR